MKEVILMGKHSDWNSLFKEVNNDLETATKNVSNIAVTIWKQLVEDKFYSQYSPVEYSRSWETLESIRIIKTKRMGGYFEIEIGYDETHIKPFTYTGLKTGIERDGHTDPSIQGYLVENGWEHTFDNGITFKREGAHAIEEMLKYVKSNDFIALFNNEMRKLGYITK